MASPKQHTYRTTTTWTGAAAGPTEDWRTFPRLYDLAAEGKATIAGSADPAMGGDGARWNPEDSLVGALSACHMLWYLHLCAVKGVKVTAYTDEAEGRMIEEPRNGRFTEVVLRPRVTITADSDPARAETLHERAHAECFIANSMNFMVRVKAEISISD
jgi:organic hydroperoxide reductase OsmC/OhrA